VFLGMNAHVNRDLPFVLASIGLTFPDGTSRKADHDKVNQFLNDVLDPLLAEEVARFDASPDDARAPTLLGYTSSFQMLAAWRETAWRNAERSSTHSMSHPGAGRAVVDADVIHRGLVHGIPQLVPVGLFESVAAPFSAGTRPGRLLGRCRRKCKIADKETTWPVVR